ncbi:unnamed protein product [Amoebophrya sp. A25]|nr:unnamed protein product [Amoebophrya sp. A25]|eukprot:GSA25T00004325001.1
MDKNFDAVQRGRSRQKNATPRKQHKNGNQVYRGLIAEKSRRFRSCSRRCSVIAVGGTSCIALALQEPNGKERREQARTEPDAEADESEGETDVDAPPDPSCDAVDRKSSIPHSFLDATGSDATGGGKVFCASGTCGPSLSTEDTRAASASQSVAEAENAPSPTTPKLEAAPGAAPGAAASPLGGDAASASAAEGQAASAAANEGKDASASPEYEKAAEEGVVGDGYCKPPATVVSSHSGGNDEFYYSEIPFDTLNREKKLSAVATGSIFGHVDVLKALQTESFYAVLSGEFACLNLGKYESKTCAQMNAPSTECYDQEINGVKSILAGGKAGGSWYVWANPSSESGKNVDFWREEKVPCNTEKHRDTSVAVHNVPLAATDPKKFFEEHWPQEAIKDGKLKKGFCKLELDTANNCKKPICVEENH